MFIEVESIEKGCTVIINLDQVLEIAPLVSGGCALFFTDGAGMNSKSAMKVKEYIRSKYINYPGLYAITYKESQILNIPYPLRKGWINEYGENEITDDQINKLELIKFSEKRKKQNSFLQEGLRNLRDEKLSLDEDQLNHLRSI